MTTEKPPSPEFMRRKFTLPETLDSRLQDLAARHYSGNVSLCIRAAIEDHEATLADNEALSLHRIENHVKSLGIEIQALADTPSSSVAQSETSGDQHEFSNLGFGTEQSDTIHRVYLEFEDSRSSLRVADIVDRLEDSPESIVRACEQLLDLGCIVEGEQPQRYRQPTLEGF